MNVSKPLLVLIDQAVVSLSSFFCMAILGRNRGSEELGIYGLAFAMLWLLTSFPNSVVWVPFTAIAPRLKPKRLKQLYSSVLVHMLLIVALMAIPAGCLALYLGQSSFQNFIAIYVFFVGMVSREHVRRISMALHEFRQLLMIDVPSSLAQIVALLLIAKTDYLSAKITLVTVGLISVTAFLSSVLGRNFSRPSIKRIYVDFLQSWKLGRWLVGVSMTGSFSDLLCRFMIASLLGLSSQGQFTASLALPSFANPIVLTSANYLRVSMARKYSTKGQRGVFDMYFQAILAFFGLACAIFGGIALLGESLSTLVFGKDFNGLGWLVAWNCLVSFISAMTIPSEAALITLNHGRDLFNSSVARLVVTISLGLVLISTLNLTGASLTLASGFLAVAILQTYYLHRLMRDTKQLISDETCLEVVR